MVFVYCNLGRSPDLDRRFCNHAELEKSATIRETGRVPITGGIIVSVQTKRKEDQDREREFTRPYACQSLISHHHQTQYNMGILQEELLHQTKRYDTLVFCKKSYWIKLTDGRESNAVRYIE